MGPVPSVATMPAGPLVVACAGSYARGRRSAARAEPTGRLGIGGATARDGQARSRVLRNGGRGMRAIGSAPIAVARC